MYLVCILYLAALNILLVSPFFKLIDLDASVSVENKENVGMKYSSACIPPEMLWENPEDKSIKVRSIENWTPAAGYDLLPASYSYDMWSFGCLLYLLCTGITLFPSSISDELVSEKDARELYEWTDDTKRDVLSRVTNASARNLVSLLLNKDPDLRPLSGHVLNHPFIRGRPLARQLGEKPKWDVYLSYREDCDSGHVSALYERLLEAGISVWWDKECLESDQRWETGFCAALLSSRCMVCLLSRLAINSPIEDKLNFEKLTSDSVCDNMLLEWRLGLELKERGILDGIFPVMIGDVDEKGVYSDYFKTGCHPVAPDLVIDDVEAQIHAHLDLDGLGSPYKERLTVKGIVTEILANQGGFYCGLVQDFMGKVVSSINEMVQDSNRALATAARKDSEICKLTRVRSTTVGW